VPFLPQVVADFNANPAVHGILVQLPLPKHISEQRILDAISIEKDVDGARSSAAKACAAAAAAPAAVAAAAAAPVGAAPSGGAGGTVDSLAAWPPPAGFHPTNIGCLAMRGREPLFVSCTPKGCMELLRRSGVELSGKRAVVVGRSNIVGTPAALLLQRADATVTVIHSRTKDGQQICAEADVIIAACGKAEMVTGDWIKPGAVVIDVGINAVDVSRRPHGAAQRTVPLPARGGARPAALPEMPGSCSELSTPGARPSRAAAPPAAQDPSAKRGYRLVGDVNFAQAKEKASFITPVPGGVGPMTIAMLLRNCVDAAERTWAAKA
jgi:5,10-methylene-tetrahydrofolate dehydrogenase/methenyl tetrahydrofolate cyclohydrolase